MKSLFSIFVCLMIAVSTLSAQNIRVQEEYDISRMMTRFTEINRQATGVPGWRIQLVATTDRRKMERDRELFLSKYPNIPIDWEHAKPYYRLRAGAFKTKLEAIRVLHILKRDYPSAFPAKVSNILPKEFVEFDE